MTVMSNFAAVQLLSTQIAENPSKNSIDDNDDINHINDKIKAYFGECQEFTYRIHCQVQSPAHERTHCQFCSIKGDF